MSRGRVLIVEDEILVAREIRSRMRDLGFDAAAVVDTGEEAVRAALAEPPDLILMDVLLKGPMDGIEAAGKILQRHFLPVVYLTAYADEATVARAKLTGPFGYVLKPFGESELRTAVELALYRHEMERKLRESEGTARALLDAVPDFAILLDRGGAILAANGVAEKRLGATESDLRGVCSYDLLPPALAASSMARLDRVFETGEAAVFEDERGGALFENRVYPVFGAEGTVTRLAVYARDITERRRLEAEHLHTAKMEAVGQLAGGIAHDFNNLLMAMMGHAELAEGRLPDGHPARRPLSSIVRAGWKAARLAQQLLAFSRKLPFCEEILDLAALLRELQELLRPLLGEAVAVRLDAEPELWSVEADRNQLEQAVANLAVNARDAMPGGGVLTLAVRNREVRGGPSESDLVSPGRYVVLEIGDTGCGMDEAVRARVFEPFFTTKPRGRGTGLGLSTVYGIVKQARGEIEVESEKGRGTTFRVYLPAAARTAPLREEALPGDPAARGSETILLVEDQEEVRSLMAEILDELGYTVLVADGPAAALNLAEERDRPIDLLLTDVVMPGMSGPELAKRVRGVRPQIRVLYMSGYAGEALARGGLAEPGTPYLQKPLSSAALARKVREVLDAPGPP